MNRDDSVVKVEFYVDRGLTDSPSASFSFPSGLALPLPSTGDVFTVFKDELAIGATVTLRIFTYELDDHGQILVRVRIGAQGLDMKGEDSTGTTSKGSVMFMPRRDVAI
jgi:hypothetical protein